jgi:hypothetical protein
VNVEELLGMPLMKSAELVTGPAGLDRPVTWCVLDRVIDFETWIMPGTLLVLTGMREDNDFEKELSFCFSYEVSGIIVIGAREFLCKENVEACAEHSLPVIKLPAGSNLINFTRRISTALSGDVNEEEREEDWLKDLCLTQGRRPNEVVAGYYGWSSSCDYMCVTFEACASEGALRVQVENHLMVAKSIVVRKGACDQVRPLTFIVKDTLVAFVPFSHGCSLGLRHKMVAKFAAAVGQAVPGTRWEVSVGSVAALLEGLAQSFYDATRVRAFVNRIGRSANPVFYDRYALEMLCLSLPQAELRRQADLILEPIHDDAELMYTLSIYLEMGENGRETAQKIYVHPSTLRYRVHKIEKILDVDLSDSWVRYRLRMAMLIDAYLCGPSAVAEAEGQEVPEESRAE